MQSSNRAQPVFLTTKELAKRWRMSHRSLEGWRDKGLGPTYHVIGSSVRYHIDVIVEFERRSTFGGEVE